MDAAKKRNDLDMLSKLTGYQDLFAYDAKYHKACYSHYISSRNIKYFNSKKISETKKSLDISLEESVADSNSDSTNGNQEVNNNPSKETSENKMLILHKAAEILRNEIESFQPKTTGFPNPNNISKNAFRDQVPEILILFMSWLVDKNLFEEVRIFQEQNNSFKCFNKYYPFQLVMDASRPWKSREIVVTP